MPLVERSIKMVLATILSIVIADYLGLHFATSSGIIALLSILDTRQLDDVSVKKLTRHNPTMREKFDQLNNH